MSGKIGKDFILNEDELRLLFQSAFISGYCAERNRDYGKLGWDYACTAEKELTKKLNEQKFIEARARQRFKDR